MGWFGKKGPEIRPGGNIPPDRVYVINWEYDPDGMRGTPSHGTVIVKSKQPDWAVTITKKFLFAHYQYGYDDIVCDCVDIDDRVIFHTIPLQKEGMDVKADGQGE